MYLESGEKATDQASTREESIKRGGGGGGGVKHIKLFMTTVFSNDQCVSSNGSRTTKTYFLHFFIS